MFVGLVDGKKGDFVGVRLDLPLGKNDGTVSGKKYFQCKPKYGIFTRPEKIVVGEFKEDELTSSSEEEI